MANRALVMVKVKQYVSFEMLMLCLTIAYFKHFNYSPQQLIRRYTAMEF